MSCACIEKNCPQLTDRSSLVAESTRQLKMAHGLHTAEARQKPSITLVATRHRLQFEEAHRRHTAMGRNVAIDLLIGESMTYRPSVRMAKVEFLVALRFAN